MKRNEKFEKYKIKALVPDLPEMTDIAPLLAEMDHTRWYSNFGPLNDRFETLLKETLEWGAAGVHVVTVSNATLGLRLALISSGLQHGARVLVPAITFPATVLAVQEAGMMPVVADVDPDSWELTPATARAAQSAGQVDAVMPVSVFGYPLNDAAWAEFSAETQTPVIMDAAAALGSQTVSSGISAVFSLHATKPLGIGEGGLFVTHDKAVADRVRYLSNFGFDFRTGQVSFEGGTNAKLAEILAAVGIMQMKRVAQIQQARAQVLGWYRTAIEALDHRVSFRVNSDHLTPATLMVDAGSNKDRFKTALEASGIQSRDWYLPPMHHHKAFKEIETFGPLTVSDRLADRLLGLPFHSFLSEGDISLIADVIAGA